MSAAARAKEFDTAAARLGRGLLALRLEVSPDIVANLHQLAQAAIAEQTARAERLETQLRLTQDDVAMKLEWAKEWRAKFQAAEARVARLRERCAYLLPIVEAYLATMSVQRDVEQHHTHCTVCSTLDDVATPCAALESLCDQVEIGNAQFEAALAEWEISDNRRLLADPAVPS